MRFRHIFIRMLFLASALARLSSADLAAGTLLLALPQLPLTLGNAVSRPRASTTGCSRIGW